MASLKSFSISQSAKNYYTLFEATVAYSLPVKRSRQLASSLILATNHSQAIPHAISPSLRWLQLRDWSANQLLVSFIGRSHDSRPLPQPCHLVSLDTAEAHQGGYSTRFTLHRRQYLPQWTVWVWRMTFMSLQHTWLAKERSPTSACRYSASKWRSFSPSHPCLALSWAWCSWVAWLARPRAAVWLASWWSLTGSTMLSNTCFMTL